MKPEQNSKHCPTFMRIAAYATAILLGGFLLILLTSCVAALIIPQQVKSIFDMSPWNLPQLTAVYFGYYSVLLFPFSVIGGWMLIRLFAFIGEKLYPNE
jgi:hypothetical protein